MKLKPISEYVDSITRFALESLHVLKVLTFQERTWSGQIRVNPHVIADVPNKKEKLKLQAVKQDWTVVFSLQDKDISPSILAVVKTNKEGKRYLSESKSYGKDIAVNLHKIRKDQKFFDSIKNPGIQEKVELAICWHRIDLNDNELLAAVVARDGTYIRHIDNPPEWLQIAAVSGCQKDDYAIRYITNPSLEVQLASVRNYPQSVKHIPDPVEAVQLEVARAPEVIFKREKGIDSWPDEYTPSAINLIPNLLFSAVVAAFGTDPDKIRGLKLTPEVQFDLMKEYNSYYLHIITPTEEMQNYIAEHNPKILYKGGEHKLTSEFAKSVYSNQHQTALAERELRADRARMESAEMPRVAVPGNQREEFLREREDMIQRLFNGGDRALDSATAEVDKLLRQDDRWSGYYR